MLEKENTTVLDKLNTLLKSIAKNPWKNEKLSQNNKEVLATNNNSINLTLIDTIHVANKLLEAHQYELYFEMVDEGYQPTKEQKKQIEKMMNALLSTSISTESLEKLNLFVEKGYCLGSEIVYKFLCRDYLDQNLLDSDFFNENFTVKDLIEVKNKTIEQIQENYDKIISEKHDNQIQTIDHIFENLNCSDVTPYMRINEQEKMISLLNKYPSLITEIRNKMFTEEFSEYASENLMKSFYIYGTYYVQAKSNLVAMINLLENAPHIFLRNTHVTQFLTFISAYKTALTSDNNLLKNLKYDQVLSNQINATFSYILKNFYKPQLDNNLNNVRNIFSEQSLDKKIVKQVHGTNYSVNNLPLQAKETIEVIKNLSIKLGEHSENISVDQQMTIKNILEKRVPEILQKYLSIDREYRTSLKNSYGKNAENLMQEALLNYKNKLDDLLKEVNENNLHNLSATQRYSQSI